MQTTMYIKSTSEKHEKEWHIICNFINIFKKTKFDYRVFTNALKSDEKKRNWVRYKKSKILRKIKTMFDKEKKNDLICQ